MARGVGAVGGRSPLLHFDDTPRTRIELGATHPGGLAQFITGKTTLLSSLIRDDLALRTAQLAASADRREGPRTALPCAASTPSTSPSASPQWHFEDDRLPRARCCCARSRSAATAATSRSSCCGNPYLNPELARALRRQFRHPARRRRVRRRSPSTDGTFKPQPVIDRLRGLTTHLEWFNVHAAPGGLVVRRRRHGDARGRRRPGASGARRAGRQPVRRNGPSKRATARSTCRRSDQRAPATDTLLLDADAEQENVVAQIAAGNSLVVKTLPGTGGTQTIVNAIGALVAAEQAGARGRRAPRRPSTASRTGSADVGLAGVAVSPATLRRDLIRSISRNEKARQPKRGRGGRRARAPAQGAARLPRSRSRAAIPNSACRCSTASRELSRLALLPNPPATTARLDRASRRGARRPDRRRAADAMLKAADARRVPLRPGRFALVRRQFRLQRAGACAPTASPSNCTTPNCRGCSSARGQLIGGTRMRPFESIAELGVYLRLLTDIRDTLDKFLPRGLRPFAQRPDRRDRRLARGLPGDVRLQPPQAPPAGERVRAPRRARHRPARRARATSSSSASLWQRFVAAGVTPEVPTGHRRRAGRATSR